ncbi:carboxypeptidase regulatory-like domain-containing protein [Ruania suaedae]|uniref:SdrD B-like domain-containing protein n=1 Tax=Ruania suaedae TaxID=2897774 RepID=UPI001E558A07|nr:SdrD B-like domain-containing protein [Ruania suaedae]UFU02188.1 carboxypeptidase regulatory-like domain-containing protein [Ruania suaedae]
MLHSALRLPLAAVATLSLVLTLLVAPFGLAPAQADGTPDIQVSQNTPTEALYGGPVPVTLTASNDTETDAYNVSVVDVIPAGVSIGNASPAPTRTVEREDGSTVVIWSNISDLLAGTDVTLTYELVPAAESFVIGDTLTNDATVLAHSDARALPAFDAAGNPVEGSFTSFAGTSAASELVPFRITKSEPSPEAELLRGVHDQQTVYTLTVDNNLLHASEHFTVVDYLPAGLEFLGCGEVDSSTAETEEYTGSGRLDTITAPAMEFPCPAPSNVQTVTTDPDGPGPLEAGVYTRVTWDAASLAEALGSASLGAAGSFSFQYVAAVPLRENVLAELDEPTANLDNNTGDLTTDEQELRNGASAQGTTLGTTAEAWDDHVVTAEDVAIVKSVDTGGDVEQGSTSTWTLDIRSSEYAQETGTITVTDTLPAALDLTGATPGVASQAEQPDGTVLLTWELPGFTEPNSDTRITYTTETRQNYRGSEAPVAANDSWTNTVDLATDATIITDNDASTEVLGIVDDSAAGQNTRGPALSKAVADRTAAIGDCTDAALTFSEDQADGQFRAGDRVCWRVTVDYPTNLDTLSPLVRDFLPEGFTFEGWEVTDANTLSTDGIDFTEDGSVLTWDLEDVASTGETFEVVVSTIVTDPNAASSADIVENLAKLSYRNSDGRAFQDRDMADVEYLAPTVTLDKSVDVEIVQGGDVATYTVAVSNSDDLDATNASVRDLLPPGITCAEVTDPGATTCSDDGETAQLQWDGLDLPAGETLELTYQVAFPDTYAPGTALDNHAGVRQFETGTNTGEPFVHVPAENIDPELTPNTTPADDPATVTVTGAETLKSQTTGLDEEGNAGADEATIGETIDYTVTATVPEGTTVEGAQLVDTLPAGVRLEGGSVATLNGEPLPDGFGTVVDSTGADGTVVTVTFPATYTNAEGSGEDVLELTFTVTVLDDAALTAGDALTNTAQLTWDGGGTSPAEVTTTIVEPDLAVAKSNDVPDGFVEPGQLVGYTVEVTNDGAASTAYEVAVTDVVPQDVTPVDAEGEAITSGTATLPGGGEWNASTRTITWQLASLAPGDSETYTYDARISDPLTSGSELTNAVTVTGTSMPGTTADERTPEAGVPGYQDSASSTLEGPVVTVAKAVDPAEATVGENLTYTLDVSVPALTRAFDTVVLDELPSGVTFDELVSVTCADCEPAIDADLIGTDGQTVGFSLGDIAPAQTDRTLTLVYTGYVDSAAGAGDTVTNTAAAYYNSTDEVTGPPAEVPSPEDFDSSTPPGEASVDIEEPALSLDKDVSGQVGDSDQRRATPGETLTYTVDITNTGGSDAFDLTVEDSPDERLLDLADETDLSQAGGVTVTDGDHTDGSLAWQVAGPLAPGETLTLTYSLTIPADWDESQEVDGPELTNTAVVTSAYGLDEDTRTDNPGREYPVYESEEDVVEVELDLASIGDTLWYDVNGDGVIDDGEPRLGGVDVTITYLGADGVPGGGDDETITVTTNENGEYLAEHLPGGEYIVSVDTESETLLEQGLAPTYDLDDGTDGADAVWQGSLGEAEAKRDVDFGFRGSAGIGDTVWFDQNRDGVKDAGEAGIPGAAVTVTWAGPDGDLSTTEDNVTYTTTTDESGTYRVGALPAGEFSVEVDLPDGYDSYVQVSGPGGEDDALDSSSQVTLTTGEENEDQDFGYAGTGSLGDTVWLDQDGDGTQNGDEPGIAGVTVEAVLTGPGGEETTLTTVTDENGGYLFENLPAGDFTVTVTGPLPGAVENTGYPDGGGDSTSAGTLADGEDNLAQDFGYYAEGLLGDRVWWDIDADGVQDDDEPGLSGVTVTATGPNGLSFTTTTGEDGEYLFENLPDGEWTVTVTDGVAEGFAPTFDADSGTENPDETSTVELIGSDLEQDFGYTGTAALGDTVWFDRDGDGNQSDGEPGLPGVGITLTWAGPDGELGTDDDLVRTTTTDAEGRYGFESLPAGEFTVSVDPQTLPEGMRATFDRDDEADGTTDVSLETGQTLDDVDFGYRGASAIGDTVWLDQDRDGELGPDEQGLSGVDVTVTWAGPDGRFGTGDEETFSTTTDADGRYLVDHLPAGEYRVDVDTDTLAPGLAATYDEDGGLDSSSELTLGADEVHDSADFGYAGEGVVGDTVYLDLDGDGSQGGSEPGVPGQPVELVWAGPDGEPGTEDDLTFTTVTDEEGRYSFEGLPDGRYQVSVPGGISEAAENTADPDGGADSVAELTLGEQEGRERLDQDFGYQGLNTLGDRIWWDDNGDGVQDEGEPGLPGVSTAVTWFGPDGEPGTSDDVLIPSPLTDAEGQYLVTGLPDGSYSVEVTGGVPEGLQISHDADGGEDGPDGISITTLQSEEGVGVEDLEQDFGYTGTGVIGDTVWLDLDGNGVRDEGEPGLTGTTVTLTWAGPNGDASTTEDNRTWTTQVDAEGHYSFDGLPAGEFGIELTDLPAGLTPTADPDGGADSSSALTLTTGEENLDQDFGYTGDASVGDTIWLDVNGNDQQDAGEPGVPGVTVTVASPGSDGVPGTADDLIITTVTDAEGRYLVENLPPGTTIVSYDAGDLPEGTTPSWDSDGEDPTTTTQPLATGEDIRTVDFAIVGTATVEGLVWEDTDGDGTQNGDEPGIGDVTVVVTWHGPDGPVELEVATDSDGRWELPNVPSGEWSAVVDPGTVPGGLVPSTPGEDSVTVPPNGSGFLEHGFVPTGSIGDLVWHDKDGDGERDEGEPGLNGVTVILTDAEGNEIARTVTDENGHYLFEDVPPGDYTVELDRSSLPEGYGPTNGTLSIDVTVGPGEDVLTADFPLAPGYDLPSTGVNPLGIAVAALLLLGLGGWLVTRRRAGETAGA